MIVSHSETTTRQIHRERDGGNHQRTCGIDTGMNVFWTSRGMSLYLDIETNYSGEITVVGMYAKSIGLVQLIRPQISKRELLDALPKVDRLYTYNGHCFDLPVIRNQFGVNLRERYESIDLRFACQRIGWKGGLKRVEQQLGIQRKFPEVDGMAAVWLWQEYWIENDQRALKTLLAYNREDVLNLIKIRKALKTQGAI